MQGDLAAGRADIEAGRALIREFGADFYVAGSAQEQAQLELESGEPAAAEIAAREAYEMYIALRGNDPSSAANLLARALLDQGRIDEADHFTRVSEEKTQPDDVGSQMEWRSARARILVRRGDRAEAEALAREAVALGEPTDYFEFHAQALIALAEALSDRSDEAAQCLEDAIRLYERKESVVGAERTRARLRELSREPLAERD
jgi:tetratricopeptide (TPR) repeat protein